MWQTSDDVVGVDVATEADSTKWMMSHTVRETKTKKQNRKTKFVEESKLKKREDKKFKFNNIDSSYLSSSIFILITYLTQ
jgi:hypothetical protein